MIAGAVRWAPELVLAAAALGGAWTAARRRGGAAGWLAAAALTLLAADALLGGAEYAGAGGAPIAAAHAAYTAVFTGLGLAAALASALAMSAPARLSGTSELLAGAALGWAASFALPLTPVLAVAHAAGALVRAPRAARVAAGGAAAALAAVVASQLLLKPSDVRLGCLHLGLAVWAAALGVQVHRGRG